MKGSLVADPDRDRCARRGRDTGRKRGNWPPCSIAWIVDSSQADGGFPREIQEFIPAEIFPAFKSIGIDYFITINSLVSLQAQRTVADYAAKVGPAGLKLLEVKSVADALSWLKSVA